MRIIKVEVNLPEAVQAIEEFRQGRARALECKRSILAGQALNSSNLHFRGVFAIGHPQLEAIMELIQFALSEVNSTVRGAQNEETSIFLNVDAYAVL